MDRIQYLQMMQQNPQNQQLMGGGVPSPIESPGLPTAAPNPLTQGSMAAMQNIRNSLQMNQQDRQRAFGLGMMQFFKNMGNPNIRPPNSGFNGALSAATQSIDPAMQAYLQEQQRVSQENAYSMEMAEKLRRQQQEEEFEREKFDYLKKHHAQQLGLEREKYGLTGAKNINIEAAKAGIDLNQFPEIDSKSPYYKSLYKDKAGSGHLIKEISDARKLVNEFESETKDSVVSPLNPYIGKYSNFAKDALGYTGISKQMEKERVLRNKLDAKLQRMSTEIERKLKGGVLSIGMMDRLKKAVPNISVDSFDDIKAKLNDLEHEARDLHDSSSLSLKLKRQVDPSDLIHFKNPEVETISESEINLSSPDIVDLVKMNMPGASEYTDDEIIEFSNTPTGQRKIKEWTKGINNE